ncbi:phosphotransferase [Actinoplanes sp. NPDC051411]|uniref:phosphotransferase n=1 Tax=Actinoplanes sp. NPDC051411 TaxID=3155522 RepID=UPI003440F1B5
MRSPTQRALSPADIQDILGSPVVDAAELSGGGFAAVWRATLPDGRQVVVKVGPPPTARLLSYERGLLRREAEYFRLVADRAPVPSVLAASDDWIVTTLLPGRPLTSADSPRARSQLGAVVASVHRVTGPHFGYVSDPAVPPGPRSHPESAPAAPPRPRSHPEPAPTAPPRPRSHPESAPAAPPRPRSHPEPAPTAPPRPRSHPESAPAAPPGPRSHRAPASEAAGERACGPDWPTAFVAMVAALRADAAAWGVPLPPLDGVVERHASVLAEVTRPALLHFDLWDGNVLAGPSGELTGLVDGERYLYGDPLLDLVSPALFRRIEDTPGHPFLRGYGLTHFDRSARIRLALYRLHLYVLMLAEAPSRGIGRDRHDRVTRLLTDEIEHLGSFGQ